jgi:hypothetical protein
MRRIIDKGYRGARPATFIQRWARKHCPKIAGTTIRQMASHWKVTESCIRKWAREETVPQVGGYGRGMNGAAKKALAAKDRPIPQPVTVEPVRTIDPMSAFLAELRARAENRLARIFLAEWPR